MTSTEYASGAAADPDSHIRAQQIQLAIFDVDGVLTDGRLYYGPQGEVFKAFHSLDGYGLKMLASAGIASAVITGRESEMVTERCRELGIAHLYQGSGNKSADFAHLLETTGWSAKDCAYMGNDWPDLAVMEQVGFAAAPADAHPEAIARAHWVSQSAGGYGAVRELCELLLRAQHRYAPLLARACAAQ